MKKRRFSSLYSLLDDLERAERLIAWAAHPPIGDVPREAASQALRNCNTAMREAREALGRLCAAQLRLLMLNVAQADAAAGGRDEQ